MITRTARSYWTVEETEKLIELHSKYGLRKASSMLNRSYYSGACQLQASKTFLKKHKILSEFLKTLN